MDQWINFYSSCFASREEAGAFVEECEALSGPHSAKIIMHQGQRLISLADDIPKIRPRRESLQLLFLIICAENIAKLADDFDGEGQSRRYVARFFERFLTPDEQERLGLSLLDADDHLQRPLGFGKVVDFLYKIRCSVVHEGVYWDLAFHDGRMPMLNVFPTQKVIAHLTFQQLRDLVAKGCVRATQSRLR